MEDRKKERIRHQSLLLHLLYCFTHNSNVPVMGSYRTTLHNICSPSILLPITIAIKLPQSCSYSFLPLHCLLQIKYPPFNFLCCLRSVSCQKPDPLLNSCNCYLLHKNIVIIKRRLRDGPWCIWAHISCASDSLPATFTLDLVL